MPEWNHPSPSRALEETDRYFARIETALEKAPRPYHIIVLSDHGQTLGLTFKNAHGVTLEELVDALIEGKGDVYTAQKTHETWDKMNALLSESVLEDTRTAKFLGSMLRSKREGDLVEVGPQTEDDKARAMKVVAVGSGSAGLIYFTHNEERLTSEQIQKDYPELIVGLQQASRDRLFAGEIGRVWEYGDWEERYSTTWMMGRSKVKIHYFPLVPMPRAT